MQRKMNQYCELDEDGKTATLFNEENLDEYKSHMKEKMMSDYKKEHMMSVDDMKEKSQRCS